MSSPTYADLADLIQYLLHHDQNLPPMLLLRAQRIGTFMHALPPSSQSDALGSLVPVSFLMALPTPSPSSVAPMPERTLRLLSYTSPTCSPSTPTCFPTTPTCLPLTPTMQAPTTPTQPSFVPTPTLGSGYILPMADIWNAGDLQSSPYGLPPSSFSAPIETPRSGLDWRTLFDINQNKMTTYSTLRFSPYKTSRPTNPLLLAAKEVHQDLSERQSSNLDLQIDPGRFPSNHCQASDENPPVEPPSVPVNCNPSVDPVEPPSVPVSCNPSLIHNDIDMFAPPSSPTPGSRDEGIAGHCLEVNLGMCVSEQNSPSGGESADQEMPPDDEISRESVDQETPSDDGVGDGHVDTGTSCEPDSSVIRPRQGPVQRQSKGNGYVHRKRRRQRGKGIGQNTP
ncbi:hypothetical protein CPB84DRAFT_1853832 [Gymnopilus junonius]|uniref:Uncharacterized protein n=1 Tax=Gymnopilus junonius TaxID=109634 RepID=A0A9P5NAE7_GYMJU|nr:hypothetical protein CPB84DRAFT_1853832 [Gymnopilus junonius]